MVISRQSQAMLVRSFARNSTGGPRTELARRGSKSRVATRRSAAGPSCQRWMVHCLGVRCSTVQSGESHQKHTEVTHLWSTDMSVVCLVDGRLAKRTRNRSALSTTAAVNMHRSPTSTPQQSAHQNQTPSAAHWLAMAHCARSRRSSDTAFALSVNIQWSWGIAEILSRTRRTLSERLINI